MTVQPTSRARRGPPAERERTDRQGGFALVLALLILVAVTVLAVGGVWVAQADSTTAVNHRMSRQAFQMADGALSRFVGEEPGVPVTPRSYDFPEGSAEVTSERLGIFAGGHEMYLLRATAQLEVNPNVTRTVTTRVMLDPLALEAPAGLSSGNNIRKDGTAGLISGFDAATSDDCPEAPQPARPGVIAENYDQSGGSGKDTEDCDGPICGDNPSPVYETSDPLGTLDIDWQGILDGTVVEFDHVISDVSNWPSVGSDEWPVIFVDNSSEVALSDAGGHSGQGILIINEDVQLDGDWHWNGVVLVGGGLTSAGNNIVYGGTVAGLDELLGESEEATDLGQGEKTFQYHSCDLLRAMKEAGTLYEVPGGWQEVL